MPTRHPRNSYFEWTDHVGPLSFITDAQMHAFDEDGFFRLEGAFDADEVARVVAEIDPIHERSVAFLRTRENEKLYIAEAGNLVFSTHLVLRSSYLRDWVAGPVFTALAGDVIGPDVRLYWEQAVYKEPEKPALVPLAPGQRLHVHRAAAVPHRAGSLSPTPPSRTDARG